MFKFIKGLFNMSNNKIQSNVISQYVIAQQQAQNYQNQSMQQTTATVFIPASSGLTPAQAQQGYWSGALSQQTPFYVNPVVTQIQGLTEAIIGYALYENNVPKEQHESFIGKHHIKILEVYHKDNYENTLINLKELIKQLKFDEDMKDLLK